MHTVGDRFPGLHAYSGYSQGCMLGRLLAHCSPSLPPSRGGSRTDWYRSTSIPVGCCTRSSLPQDATGMLQRSSQQHHSSITAASSVLPALALLALLGQDGLQHHYSSTTASLQQHYSSTTASLQHHYSITTAALQHHYSSTCDMLEMFGTSRNTIICPSGHVTPRVLETCQQARV